MLDYQEMKIKKKLVFPTISFPKREQNMNDGSDKIDVEWPIRRW